MVVPIICFHCLFFFSLPCSPSQFDFDAVTASDREKSLKNAFDLATTAYGVPPIFDVEGKHISDISDVGTLIMLSPYLWGYVRVLMGGGCL